MNCISLFSDDRSDYYRFKAGYLNSSAILAKIDTRHGLTHTVNASILLYLQAPKVLYTQINWHPQWPQDLKVINQNIFNTQLKMPGPIASDFFQTSEILGSEERSYFSHYPW